jgi:predicted phage tail protein
MTPKFESTLKMVAVLLVTLAIAYLFSAIAASPTSPPTAPSNLTATAISCSCIALNWRDNSTNESGFKIERCQGSGCSNFAQIAQVGANVTSYNDTTVTAGVSYSYRVRAFNTAGNSAYSNTATATPSPSPCPSPTPGDTSGAE